MLLEICVDSFPSALAAADADRLELCQDLSVGGLTPSVGFYRIIKSQLKSVPLFILIRSRSGNFVYEDLEISQMVEDIKVFRENGADGIVVGALTRNGHVDKIACQKFIAFDVAINKEKALEDIIELGFKRILTSGGYSSAFEGIHILKTLISQADSRIIIMPGGGITCENIREVMKETKASEFHSSGRRSIEGLQEKLSSKLAVLQMKQIINDAH